MKTIDATGHKCPMPLILTKRALIGMDPGELLEVLVDNETSVKNVTRFLTDNRMTVKTELRDGIFRMTVSKAGEITEETRAEEYCEIPKPVTGDYVVSFQKNIEGPGADELGVRLTHLFINTLVDIDQKPATLTFLNSSIALVLKDSPVLDALKRIEGEGVSILVCGTCLDFFGKREELAVGIISNMYEILDRMAKAPKVLYP